MTGSSSLTFIPPHIKDPEDKPLVVKETGKRMGTVIRGLLTLLIFVLSFVITAMVSIAISITVLHNMLGYDLFPWGPNPTPDWLSKTFFWANVAVSLGLASFLGWKSWTRSRR